MIESASLPVIRGYRNMLEYLFLHIIDTALKFHDENTNPRIIINCKNVTGSQENKKELAPDKAYLKISFQDNGIGFSKEDAGRIFNLFEKLNDKKYHGSGVGLTKSRKIVETHEGFIDALPLAENGAIFNCYFPIVEEE